MSFEAIPSTVWVNVADTSEVLRLGAFSLTESMELVYVLQSIYKFGTAGGTETLTAKIYSDSAYSVVLKSSTAFSLSTITAIPEYWIGNIRFDFDSYQLKSGTTYYLGIAFANYTRNADTFFIGAVMDTYSQINTQARVWQPGTAFTLIGRK